MYRWAWQNSHLTKKIAEDQRISLRETVTHISSKSGKTRRRPARPRSSLADKLSNLHLLLRVPSFARWPLEVRFFCEDVHKVWQRWNEKVDGKIRNGIKIFLDMKQPAEFPDDCQPPTSSQAKRKSKQKAHGSGGVECVDVGYGELKSHVDKSLLLFSEGDAYRCAVCTERFGSPAGTALVCPKENCQSVSHMTCLSSRFLDEEGVPGSMVPTSGSCPQCKSTLQWIDLVKEMSLRVRGEKELTQFMKRPRVRKTKTIKCTTTLQANDLTKEMQGEADEEGDYDLPEDAMHPRYESEEPLPADWYQQINDDDEDVMSVTSADSEYSNYLDAARPPRSKVPTQKLEVVIEDSDWSNAEVLD